MSNSTDIIRSCLQKYFGFNSFRPLQQDIIIRVLEGKDSVVLMPTGAGKSLCYQLPSLLMDGLTVVISPLIALMKDQVESLKSNGIAAAYLNSSLSSSEELAVKSALELKNLKLLYVSPERIFSRGFIPYLHKLDVRLFAIDEAHCISSWGHQFRPEYSRLSVIKHEFPQVPVIALTATADEAVRSDIAELLNLDSAELYISSFDRPNLSLAVLPGVNKWQQIIGILSRHKGHTGIIYCTSRKYTEILSAKLLKAGICAAHYHAGLDPHERNSVQNDFLSDKIDIICATVAFGMGIDKSNIRFVIHYNLPGNLESFYQELGRAGRDGLEAETVLFYSYRDVQIHMKFINEVTGNKYRNILTDKLKRMKEYADAQVCRRKILLSYFGEYPLNDCNNCDVCQNPPTYFNGTQIAQIALSAIYRVRQKASLTMLIDILRGVKSNDIIRQGFSRIKTFGAGREITAFAWHLYLQQLIQLGLMAVDYKNNSRLKLTPLSRDVLFSEKEVKLVNFETIKQRQQKKVEVEETVIDTEQDIDEELYQKLKELRNKMASGMGKPAYIIFSNSAIREMSIKKPVSMEDFLVVNGVGEYKAETYGERFIELIREHILKIRT